MNSIYNYLLEANLCLLVFGLFYYFALKNETHFRFSRYYLVGSALLAVVIPLLHFDNPFAGNTVVPVVGELQPMMLPELVIGAQVVPKVTQEAFSWTWPMIAMAIYGTITAIFLTLFFYQLYQIVQFKRLKRRTIEQKDDHVLIHTDGQLPTFSFFNMLFFDNTVALPAQDKQQIIDHELVHIREWHTLDTLVLEFTKTLFWINPVAWWMRKNIRDVHEYLADQQVLKNTDQEEYSSLLAKMALKHLPLPLGHHFNRSLTLKRIKMMKSPKTKLRLWKWASMIPLVMSVAFVLSCNDEVMKEVDEVMETTTQMDIPEEMKNSLKKLQKRYPDAEFIYMETDGDNVRSLLELQDFDPKTIGDVIIWDKRDRVGALVNKNGPLPRPHNDLPPGVFQIVTDPAKPIGGYKAFYKRIADSLEYPAAAKEAGFEGKVYVRFIVNEKGKKTDLKVVKGIGFGCDEAALEAIRKAGDFTPPYQKGKAVKQAIILPITFKLGVKKNNEKVSFKWDKSESSKMFSLGPWRRDKSSIKGRVTDLWSVTNLTEEPKPISNMIITLIGNTGEKIDETKTGKDGYYHLSSEQIGEGGTIRFYHPAYAKFTSWIEPLPEP